MGDSTAHKLKNSPAGANCFKQWAPGKTRGYPALKKNNSKNKKKGKERKYSKKKDRNVKMASKPKYSSFVLDPIEGTSPALLFFQNFTFEFSF